MSVCAVCDREGLWRGHHLTGRDDADTYLDVDLIVPLCHDHHMLCHDDWHTLELVGIDHRLTLIERVELRLLRIAAALSRIDPDRLAPEWRSDPGFYSSEDE